MSLLRTYKLTKSFGGVIAVKSLSLEVDKNSILGLIGPNGSGKTTFFNLINGVYKPDAGKIFFKNEDITGLEPYKIARRGIGRLFQTPRIFHRLTVLENMLLPSLPQKRKRTHSLHNVGKALKLLEYAGLIHLKNECAGNLSGGQQKLLELVRLSMAEPELYLLDEPFAGVHPQMREKMINYIKDLRDKENKTFIVITHEISAAMKLCDEICVLSYGELIARGKPKEIEKNERVIEAYMGV